MGKDKNKISREEAGEMVREADDHLKVTEYMIENLPKTPGREAAKEGARKCREGLEQIKKEAETVREEENDG
jgi:hypothetical protein